MSVLGHRRDRGDEWDVKIRELTNYLMSVLGHRGDGGDVKIRELTI